MNTHILKVITVTLALLSLAACNSTARTTNNAYQDKCQTINSTRLNSATDSAKSSLNTGQCSHKFADYFQNLLTVAKGSPDSGNKKKFDDFISWSVNHQIISKLDAKEYFNRYFGERFISLDNTYNTCSQGTKQAEIFTALNQEMQDKKLGLLEVLGDKTRFIAVSAQHRDIKTILEATWMACEA